MSEDEHRPPDRPRVHDIPCPFLAAAYNSGDLVCAEDGTLSIDALEAALTKAGLGEGLIKKVARGAGEKTEGPDDELNLFALRDSAVDHTGNTGIRDPEVDADMVPRLLAFGEGGRLYLRHLAAAANHFRHTDPGLEGTAVQTLEMTALLTVFGREDEHGDRYLTDDDVHTLWIDARYPDDWTPRPAGSISTAELLKNTAKMGGLRVAQRARTEVQEATQMVTKAIKDLLP